MCTYETIEDQRFSERVPTENGVLLLEIGRLMDKSVTQDELLNIY